MTALAVAHNTTVDGIVAYEVKVFEEKLRSTPSEAGLAIRWGQDWISELQLRGAVECGEHLIVLYMRRFTFEYKYRKIYGTHSYFKRLTMLQRAIKVCQENLDYYRSLEGRIKDEASVVLKKYIEEVQAEVFASLPPVRLFGF